MSTIDPTLSNPLRPAFPPPSSTSTPPTEPPNTASLIRTLHLQPHPEGGYYANTDRDPRRVANPFLPTAKLARATVSTAHPASEDERKDLTRHASSSVVYLLTPARSVGHFHRNKARTVHTLHRGRGRYVVVHADEVKGGGGGKARVETFVVGQDVESGERLQWVVEGGKYKASFLLQDQEGGEGSGGLLISETVVPGFEHQDHDLLRPERLMELVTEEQARELDWLLREDAPEH